MSSIPRTIRVLAALLPLGAAGMSSALASAARPAVPPGGAEQGVASRLEAIRAAVSQVAIGHATVPPADPALQKAWWANWGVRPWGNGGWRNWRNGWGNGGWNNWRNGWGNGGWHNWHNGGWPNVWRNW